MYLLDPRQHPLVDCFFQPIALPYNPCRISNPVNFNIWMTFVKFSSVSSKVFGLYGRVNSSSVSANADVASNDPTANDLKNPKLNFILYPQCGLVV